MYREVSLHQKIDRWKRLITAGNLGYDFKDYTGAIEAYSKAKRIALGLFNDTRSAKDIVPMLVISYHNLADTYKMKKDLIKARKELEQVHDFLTDALHDTQQYSQDMLTSVHRGVGKTQNELFNFLKENSMALEGNISPLKTKIN